MGCVCGGGGGGGVNGGGALGCLRLLRLNCMHESTIIGTPHTHTVFPATVILAFHLSAWRCQLTPRYSDLFRHGCPLASTWALLPRFFMAGTTCSRGATAATGATGFSPTPKLVPACSPRNLITAVSKARAASTSSLKVPKWCVLPPMVTCARHLLFCLCQHTPRYLLFGVPALSDAVSSHMLVVLLPAPALPTAAAARIANESLRGEEEEEGKEEAPAPPAAPGTLEGFASSPRSHSLSFARLPRGAVVNLFVYANFSAAISGSIGPGGEHETIASPYVCCLVTIS